MAPDARLAELLTQRKGRPLLVNFWASWCEPCREEMPALQRLDERWRSRGGSVITIAVADNETRAEAFFARHALGLPLLHDPDQAIARAWGVRMLPTTVVLDRRHRIAGRGSGVIDWDAAATEKQLQTLFK